MLTINWKIVQQFYAFIFCELYPHILQKNFQVTSINLLTFKK